MISAVLEIAPSCPCSLVYARRFPRLSVVVSAILLGRKLLLSIFFCSEPFGSVLEVDDLCEELGRNCVAAQDTPVRCSIEFQSIVCRFEINHKQSVTMVLHAEVGLVLPVGVRIQWRYE